MSRRNVTYIKPEEPSFLKKIKEQAGYKEGPTVDTKREDLGPVEDDPEFEQRREEEEEPTVVVLQPGDLTAEEAASIKEEVRKEAEKAPADLNKRIVFKAPSKSKSSEEEKEKAKPRGSKRSSQEQDKKSKKLKNKAPLSFNEDEEEDS